MKALGDLIKKQAKLLDKLLLKSWLTRFVFPFPYVLNSISVPITSHHFISCVSNLVFLFEYLSLLDRIFMLIIFVSV